MYNVGLLGKNAHSLSDFAPSVSSSSCIHAHRSVRRAVSLGSNQKVTQVESECLKTTWGEEKRNDRLRKRAEICLPCQPVSPVFKNLWRYYFFHVTHILEAVYYWNLHWIVVILFKYVK